ncbi:nucleoside kinase [Breznakiellaceae bacterium SP9]
MNTIQVRFLQNNEEAKITVQSGTKIAALAERFGQAAGAIAAVKLNNEVLPLAAHIEMNCFLEPIPLDSPEGMMIYRRSLAFLLAMAVQQLFPQRSLYIGHSLGNTYYYTFADGTKPGSQEITALKEAMHALVSKDLPIECRCLAYSEALELFTQNTQADTALLLEERSEAKIRVNECAQFTDIYIEALVERTGLLTVFDLIAYQDGLLLCFPGIGKGMKLEAFEDSPKIFEVYDEYKKWGRNIGVNAVGHLNRMISERTIQEYIRIAEAFQAKKLSDIAAQVYKRRGTARVILIAGPSSSGKTTTAKRLSIELKVLGLDPIAISLDDYYLGTDKTPRDDAGSPDFEALEALDIPYLNRQLLSLFAGSEVRLPVFDFKAGRRKETPGRTISLSDPRSLLIIEGIHGLNDALTPHVDPSMKFKLYVSALTQLNLDDHNRIPTSDNRLLRRLVRDSQFRGKAGAATIKMWPSVQSGERKHIFPFQNGADAAFNSALDYELSVLKFYAQPLLKGVKPNVTEYAEAARLLSFLENFAPIPPQYVPVNSILREFIGGSEFKY